MPKRSSKDLNQTAASIVARATGEFAVLDDPDTKKNPAAVALGRLGGLKGGKARAASLSVQKRKEIASIAAKTRWKGHKK